MFAPTIHVVDGTLVGGQELATLVEQKLEHWVIVAHCNHAQVVVIRICVASLHDLQKGEAEIGRMRRARDNET